MLQNNVPLSDCGDIIRILNRMENDVDGVVDTRAIYTFMKRMLLESIRIKPVEKRKFRAFGGEVERDIGIAEIELMGRRGGITVIFGEEEDAAILGVTAFEVLVLAVDPIRNTLKEAQLLMLDACPSNDTFRARVHRVAHG